MGWYRKIDSRVWYDEKFRRLSPTAQRFYLYLLTSPHSTAWGAYVLDDLYIQADLGMSPQKIKECWQELANLSLTLRCNATRLVCFPNWFRYNRPANKKSASACIRGLRDLPKSPVLKEFFLKSEWVSEQLANLGLTVSELLGDEEKEKEKEKENENICISSNEEILSDSSSDVRLSLSDVIEQYNLLCPSMPQAKPTDQRKARFTAQLRKYPALDHWQDVFRRAEASDFLSGRSGQWTGCSFDWFRSEEKRQRVLEGVYDNRQVRKTAEDYARERGLL